MFSIRKFVGYSAAVLGLGVIAAIALAPQAGLAAVPSFKLHGPAAALRFALPNVTPISACTQARQALDAARTQDAAEDVTEKKPAQSTKPVETAEQAEDKAEKAAMKLLSDAVRRACAPPVTAQCAAARTALDAAKAKDVDEDAAEKTTNKADKKGAEDPADKDEDNSEAADLKPLRDAVRAACESPEPAPSAVCVAAKQALKAAKDQDKIEDKAEKGPKQTSDADKAQDKIEDKSERDNMRPLQQAMRDACGHH